MKGAPRRVAESRSTPETIYEEFHPSSDWTHDPNCHVLLIDLPGFKKEELKVKVDNFGKVTVSGERQVGANIYQRFKKVFGVPEDADEESMSGRFDGGLLFIIMPRKKVEEVEEPKNGNGTAVNEIEEEKNDEDRVKEEIPKKDDVHEHDHGSDLHDEKKEESEKNSQQGPYENRMHKREDANKEDSERKDWKGGLIGDGKQKKEWTKMTAQLKNKEEMEVLMKNAMENIRKNKTVITTALLAFSVGAYISHLFHSGGK